MKQQLLETLSRKINKEYSLDYYYCTITGSHNQLSIKEKSKRKELINSRGIMHRTALNYFLCCDVLELHGSEANVCHKWGDNFEDAFTQYEITEYKFEVRHINKNKTILKIVKA